MRVPLTENRARRKGNAMKGELKEKESESIDALRLAHAAHDLLAALEWLYEVASVDRDEDYAAVTNAAAAIAKARGPA
jgi:hypothetical protein